MSAKIFSVAKSFYEQRTKYDNLSKSEKDPIDSFLSFVSFVTKDKSYYPFWAKIGFENCSSFISEYVCFDYENHPSNLDFDSHKMVNEHSLLPERHRLAINDIVNNIGKRISERVWTACNPMGNAVDRLSLGPNKGEVKENGRRVLNIRLGLKTL